MAKIGVIIPARNEEAVLERTLEHLSSQSRRPDVILVVDDGSEDRTAEIARTNGAQVLHLPNTGSKAGRPELAEVINAGLRTISKFAQLDYVMVLGADHPLPPNYLEEMLPRMDKDENLVMASARILGEASFTEVPNPSGRIYRFSFMREIGFFPVNYGWEDYTVYKALMMKHKTKFYDDIISTQQRPLRISRQKMYFWGMGMKALGYDPLYALGRFFRWFRRSPSASISMLAGYLSSDVEKYPDLSDFLGKWQRKVLWTRVRQLPTLLR